MAASDEVFLQHSLEFVDGLKDLRNLRTQLYSAAEYFESSFGDTDDNQQYATDSCKDYVATAFVRTVDHLGSVADKLTSFLEQKTDEFSRTNIRCSCLEQRLNTLTRMRSLWQHKLMTEAPLHHKRYIFPDNKTIAYEKTSKITYFSSPYDDNLQQHYKDNPFATAFKKEEKKAKLPQYRKDNNTRGSPLHPAIFSLEEEGRRSSVSPLVFPFKRSGSAANRSGSPISRNDAHRSSSVPRKSVVVWRSPDVTTKRDNNELDAYAKKSKSFFNALFSTRKSRKGSSAAAY